jgi:hypothetical protein
MLRPVLASLLLVLSAACAQVPKPQLQAYSEAFQAAQTAAAPVLESYAVSERAASRSELESRLAANKYFVEFTPDDAASISTLTLPAGAAAANRAFDGIAHYNEMLVALAENRNIGEAQGQLKQVISSLTGIAPPLAAAVPGLESAKNLLVAALTPAIREGNRQEFARLVLKGRGDVAELIDVIRRLTPTQYRLITGPLQDRWVFEKENRPAIAKEINGWHAVFADYVVLLDAMKAKLDLLHFAVEHPQSTPILARAALGAADLKTYADDLRRSIAELRTPK